MRFIIPSARGAFILAVGLGAAFLAATGPAAADDTRLGTLVATSTSKNPNEDTTVTAQFDLFRTSDGHYYAKFSGTGDPKEAPWISEGMDAKYIDPDTKQIVTVVQPNGDYFSPSQDLRNQINQLIPISPTRPGQVGIQVFSLTMPSGIASEFLNLNPPLYGTLPVQSLAYFGIASSPSLDELLGAATPGGTPEVFTYDPSKLGLSLGTTAGVDDVLTFTPLDAVPTGSATDSIVLGLPVPEPSSIALTGLGGLALATVALRGRGKRKRKRG